MKKDWKNKMLECGLLYIDKTGHECYSDELPWWALEPVRCLVTTLERTEKENSRLKQINKSTQHGIGTATSPQELRKRIMDSRIPKSEAEWWAKAEIERLLLVVEKAKSLKEKK